MGPPGNAKRRHAGGGAAVLTGNGSAVEHSPTPRPAQHLRRCPRFRRLTERLWRLGPRPCAEGMLLVAEGRDLIDVLEGFTELDAKLVRHLEARNWPPTPLEVAA